MENITTVKEVFSLPSKGLIYDKQINPEVSLRSMTTEEEMLRLAPSDLPYKPLCNMIDACIENDIGISSYDMCLGDYQFLLHRVRIVTYGDEYQSESICPYCGKKNSTKTNLTELEIKEYSEDIKKYLNFTLPRSKKEVEITFQTPRILDEITKRNKERLKKTEKEQDFTLAITLDMLIKTIDGEKPSPMAKDSFIKNLPMMDVNYILQANEKISDQIGIDPSIIIKCEECGVEYLSSFRYSTEFFRPTVF